ncbi:hypothetical protein KBD59_04430 [Candidatus Gracilibacteria bacterium]|nr:hypothetical protein [Candidatus Gracilibacteria bacterium]
MKKLLTVLVLLTLGLTGCGTPRDLRITTAQGTLTPTYSVAPGGIIKTKVQLTNTTPEEHTYDVFSYVEAAESEFSQTSSWVGLNERSPIIPGSSDYNIYVTIAVPAATPAGDYKVRVYVRPYIADEQFGEKEAITFAVRVLADGEMMINDTLSF